MYSFNGGKEAVTERYPLLIPEVNAAIRRVNAAEHKVKTSKEKTMPGRMLFSEKRGSLGHLWTRWDKVLKIAHCHSYGNFLGTAFGGLSHGVQQR